MTNVFINMPFEWFDDENNKIYPISALVIMKGLDESGEEVHSILPTEGLSAIDALALSHYAMIYAENKVRKYLEDSEE